MFTHEFEIALYTFEQLMGYEDVDIFDAEGLVSHYEENLDYDTVRQCTDWESQDYE